MSTKVDRFNKISLKQLNTAQKFSEKIQATGFDFKLENEHAIVSRVPFVGGTHKLQVEDIREYLELLNHSTDSKPPAVTRILNSLACRGKRMFIFMSY